MLPLNNGISMCVYTISYILLLKEKNKYTLSGLFKLNVLNCFTASYSLQTLDREHVWAGLGDYSKYLSQEKAGGLLGSFLVSPPPPKKEKRNNY